jgi:P27 family predicted phage terminase small subunit
MRGRKPNLTTDSGALREAPRPPTWLSKDAKAEWRRILPGLIERRIVTDGDLGTLENYCCAIGAVRECERILQRDGHVVDTDRGPKRHPASTAMKDGMTIARQLAAELGLTPVSRSRPSVRDDSDEDDLLG